MSKGNDIKTGMLVQGRLLSQLIGVIIAVRKCTGQDFFAAKCETCSHITGDILLLPSFTVSHNWCLGRPEAFEILEELPCETN
jgi:hypothetical protein